MKIIVIAIIILSFFPFWRMFFSHVPHTIKYVFNDIYNYVINRKWRNWNESWCGIYQFCGYFGHGKTLSATHKALQIYARMKKYGKKVRIISNYELKHVPYIPLTSFDQIVEIGKIAAELDDKGKRKDSYEGTIILIDEIEFLLNNRKFASFPTALLSAICQQRKGHIVIYTTLQRWHMCDKSFRDLSLWCVDCSKFWRFQRNRYYDGWDVENATSNQMIQCKKTEWWFVENRFYDAYDTTKMISQSSADDFISNEESIRNRGIESVRNDDIVKHPSKKLRKVRKTK